MFDSVNRKEVVLETMILCGVVHLDDLVVTSIIDKDEGIHTKINGGLYPESGTFDLEFPISMTLKKDGTLRYHSVPAMMHGKVNVMSNESELTKVLEQATGNMVQDIANERMAELTPITDDRARAIKLMDYFFDIVKANQKARDSVLKTI